MPTERPRLRASALWGGNPFAAPARTQPKYHYWYCNICGLSAARIHQNADGTVTKEGRGGHNLETGECPYRTTDGTPGENVPETKPQPLPNSSQIIHRGTDYGNYGNRGVIWIDEVPARWHDIDWSAPRLSDIEKVAAFGRQLGVSGWRLAE